MHTRMLLLPCIYIYKGLTAIWHFIKTFFKYVIIGIKSIPNLIAGLFAPKKEKTDKIEKLGQKVIDSSKTISDKINENVKTIKGKNQEELKINFDSKDAEKSEEKVTYKYVAKDKDGKDITGYFEAHSKVEVNSFLLNEGYTVYEIKTSKLIQLLHGSKEMTNRKIKTKDLIFMIAQLSTYLKVGIPLADAVNKLTKQFKNPQHQKILKAISYDLSIGQSFSESLEKQGKAFPKLFINMVKTAEMTGQLPETLDDMETYYSETEATRKAMVSAMMYPTIIFVVAIGVGLFIMLFVVPKFIDIYNSMDNTQIPGITQFVLNLSNFLNDYVILIALAVVIFLLIFTYLYRKVPAFRTAVQWTGMHIPVIKNVIIYNEVTMFTKTFSSLLANNIFITDSMDILTKITNNEIYKQMINKAIKNIQEGGKISTAFKDQWAFPIPAYEMIVTGEDTGQLAEMMYKVSQYYQDLHKNAVARIKTFLEPTMILLLTVMVGVIVLAIVVPMFNMYSAIQQ